MEGTQSPGAPTPQLWSELTCPSVQLPFSPTGMGRLLAGPQSCVRSKWPAWNDPLKSETQTTQRVDVVNVRSLGQHISHQTVEPWTSLIGCSILPSHSFGNTQLPSQPWVQQVVSVSESQAGLGNLCSGARSGWPDAPHGLGYGSAARQEADAHWPGQEGKGWSRQCPGARQVLLNLFPHL